jgi:formamidopyrimidine-DNA glycosylase
MPELPEVETTRRGIEPHVAGRRVRRVVVRDARLRWPVPPSLSKKLPGLRIDAVTRRAKYLLLETKAGTVIMHLGMSGSLRITDADAPVRKHDHVDIVLDSGDCLRLCDPRRFGAVLWTDQPAHEHKLLANLGPEPLSPQFSGKYLYDMSRGRSRALRDFLLDGQVVAGVGNIYANEALYAAGIRPSRPAGRLTRQESDKLVRSVRATLKRALRAGGTTLRDFRGAKGETGYFQLSLKVYGRNDKPCPACRSPIRLRRLGQRSAFYCGRCQS